MKLGQVAGMVGLLLVGYVARGAAGCSSARADDAPEPTVVATVKCTKDGDTVKQAFAGKSREWIAANIVPLRVDPKSGASMTLGTISGDSMTVSCDAGQSIEFLER